jgi:isoleucyl-tRNA synthetase
MSTVLRREPPFRTIFGFATLFGEDGRPMHKSWGNFIEFDDAAERMGVDVMRWMFLSARPEDNILFGWHSADAARRELLILWNVYAFFVTYARLAGWTPARPARQPGERAALDRWILSRLAGLAGWVDGRLRDYNADGAARAVSGFVDELSTWYLRRSRKRFSRSHDIQDRDDAFATLHAVLVGLTKLLAPMLPFLTEAMWQNLVVAVAAEAPGTDAGPGPAGAPDSVHLARWPLEELVPARDEALEAAMATVLRAVDLARTLRSQSGLRVRQPLGRAWIALPGGDLLEREALLALFVDEVNVREVRLIDDESELVQRRLKPLLPRIGRKLGPAVPAVMAAAREGRFEIRPDGSVEVAGLVLAPDEVEILASPRPGTAVAHDDGLVVVLDTTLDDDLRAEGDARELQRAIQDLRREAGLELDDRIEVVLAVDPGVGLRLEPHLAAVAAEVLADGVELGPVPAGWSRAAVDIGGGAAVAIQAVGAG